MVEIFILMYMESCHGINTNIIILRYLFRKLQNIQLHHIQHELFPYNTLVDDLKHHIFPSDHDHHLPPGVIFSDRDGWRRTVNAKPPGPHSKGVDRAVSLSRKPCVTTVYGRVDWSAKYGGNRNR